MNEDHSAAEALYAAYQGILKAQDVDFEMADEGFLMLMGDADCGRCEGYLSIDDVTAGEDESEVDAVVIQVAFMLPEAAFPSVPVPSRLAVYELAGYLAPDLPIGGFELDPDDGRLRFRMSQVWPACALAPALMLAPLVESVSAIDDCAALFAKVLGEGYEPSHVYAENALAEYVAAEEKPDSLERERLLSVVSVAGDRYRARGDTARLDELAEVIRGLSAA